MTPAPMTGKVVSTVMTARESSIPDSVNAHTPESTPANVRVIAMGIWSQVGVRAIRTYLQTFGALMGVGQAGEMTGFNIDMGLLPEQFIPQLKSAATLALIAAFGSAVHNMSEMLAKLDEKFPQIRA